MIRFNTLDPHGVQGGNPSARRMMKGAKGEVTPSQRSGLGNASINGVTHGYRSLAPENAGEYPFLGAPRDPGLSSVLRASREPSE